MSRERTGTIDQTKDGRWRLRVTTPDGRRRTFGIYDTWEEAETQRIAYLEVTHESDESAWRVGKWVSKVLTERETSGAIRDPDSDWSRFRTHIENDPIALLPLRTLRRRHVRDWMGRVRKKVARQTALNVLNVLRVSLGVALEDELVRANVAAGMKVAPDKRTEEPWTFLTVPEQRRLVLVADEAERWLFAFAIGTGLRAGELVSLRRRDLKVDGDHPHLVVRYGGAPEEPVKWGRIREVPLFGMGLLAAQQIQKVTPNPHGLVFPRVRGGFRDEAHVTRWETWKDMLAAAGIDRPFRFHDLRHTCASSMVSGVWGRTWTLLEVRDLLGHRSVTTTERYAHLAGTALQRAAAEHRAIRSQLAIVAASARNPSEEQRLPKPWAGGSSPPEDASGKTEAIAIGALAADGQLLATCEAFLKAVVAGQEAASEALAARMGGDLFANRARATAFAEAVLLAAKKEPSSAAG